MAQIAPFRALRYDPTRVRPDQVVTQPYDKITPAMQDRYYAASPYNLVRIILGRREPELATDNVYSRAAGFFHDWRHQGILQQDAEPSIYSYSQIFRLPGSTQDYERRGFIALGRIEDYRENVVFRHEQTLARPKADRLQLLRATRAHFGQLFMLYGDTGEVESLLATSKNPDTELEDEYGVTHRLWRVSDPALIARIGHELSQKQLIIADGHHRYETALAYRDECRASSPEAGRTATGTAPHDFVMMTFVNMNSPGLFILPTHRVVHSLPSFFADQFLERARNYFNVEEVDASVDASRATGILRQAGRVGTVFVAVTRQRDFLLHTPRVSNSALFAGLSVRQQSLDVVQLHKVLLENVLGLSEESIRNQENLAYVRETDDAMARVRSGAADIAFLMNPVRIQQVRDIALAGEVLPQKSTDFYPKLLSGLAIYALD
jgi:uncharacterized protein (DUF1015 family)